jgi:WD40 repeat protein
LIVFKDNFEVKSSFNAHSTQINRIKQSPYDFNYVATASSDSTVKIWQTLNETLSLLRTYTGHTLGVNGLEYIDSDAVASGSDDGVIHIWSISSGLANVTINTGQGVLSLQMLNDGVHLVAGMQPNIKIYNVNTGSLIATLQGHTSSVDDLVLLYGENNNNLLASSGGDSTIRIWDLNNYTCKMTLSGHTSQILGLKQVSSDILSSGSDDATVKLWNITSGLQIRSLYNYRTFSSIDVLSDEQTLVTSSWDGYVGYVRLWDINTGENVGDINAGLMIRSLAIIKTKTSTKSKRFQLNIRLNTYFTLNATSSCINRNHPYLMET